MSARKNVNPDALETEKVGEFEYVTRRINLAYRDLMVTALSSAVSVTDRLFNPDGTATEDTYRDLMEISHLILAATKYGVDLTQLHTPEPEPVMEPVSDAPYVVFSMPFPPFSGSGEGMPDAPWVMDPASGAEDSTGVYLPETIKHLFAALKADPRTNGAMDGVIGNEEADAAILKKAEEAGIDPNSLRGDDLRGFPVRTRENHKAWVEKWMGEDDYVLHFEDGTHHVYMRPEFRVSK